MSDKSLQYSFQKEVARKRYDYKKDFYNHFLKGYTLQEIANLHNISRERVRQILEERFSLSKNERVRHYVRRNLRIRKARISNRKVLTEKIGKLSGKSSFIDKGKFFENLVSEKLDNIEYWYIRLSQSSFIDFIINGYRVDIKGALKVQYPNKHNPNGKSMAPGFIFKSTKKQTMFCEFIICVYKWKGSFRFYIVPIKEISESGIIIIMANPKREDKYSKYLDKWDLLIPKF